MGSPVERTLYQSFPMRGNERAQIWPYAPEYRRPRHFHAEHEVNLVVAGRARFGVGMRVVDAGPGELLAFPPGQDHVLMDASHDLVLFAIGMEPSLTSDVVRSSRTRVLLPTHTRPSATEWKALVQKVTALTGGTCSGLVAELWQRLHDLSTVDGRSDSGLHVLTRRTIETLTSAPDMSRDELARTARANRSELSRFFHRDFGMTLVEYRTRLRLLRFIHLVDEQGSSLMSAAIHSGFGSYSQCHRSFQAELACAPRVFFGTGFRERMENTFEPVTP